MQELKDKVAVVTGGASGIGRALGEVFAEQGMRIVLADVEAAALEKTAQEIAESGAEVLPMLTDVRKPEDVEALAQKTLSHFGAVDVVCNNAGVFTAGTTWEEPLEDYEWVMGVNLWGVIHGIRTFVPILLEQQREAHIVNTASMAGLTTLPYAGIYHMTKHAVLALSECLYYELQARGPHVKVSALCPELVATQIDRCERNRPAELAAELDTTEAKVVQRFIREGVKTGLPPRVLAERTLKAIREERFYILAEDGWRDVCHTRLDDIRAARNPTLSLPTS